MFQQNDNLRRQLTTGGFRLASYLNALFDAPAERDAAAVRLAESHPHWWQMAGTLR